MYKLRVMRAVVRIAGPCCWRGNSRSGVSNRDAGISVSAFSASAELNQKPPVILTIRNHATGARNFFS